MKQSNLQEKGVDEEEEQEQEREEEEEEEEEEDRCGGVLCGLSDACIVAGWTRTLLAVIGVGDI